MLKFIFAFLYASYRRIRYSSALPTLECFEISFFFSKSLASRSKLQKIPQSIYTDWTSACPFIHLSFCPSAQLCSTCGKHSRVQKNQRHRLQAWKKIWKYPGRVKGRTYRATQTENIFTFHFICSLLGINFRFCFKKYENYVFSFF